MADKNKKMAKETHRHPRPLRRSFSEASESLAYRQAGGDPGENEQKRFYRENNRFIPSIFIGILIIGALFCANSFVFGQEDRQANSEIKELNSEIQKKKDEMKRLQDEQKKYTDSIRKKQAEKASLKNQLSILDNRLAKAEIDIASTEVEIERMNLEIRKTTLEIEDKNREIEKEKEHIAKALKLIYKKDQLGSLEILLLNNSFAEFYNEVKYLEDINSELKNKIEILKDGKEELENQKVDLDKKNKELVDLKKTFDDQLASLEGERGNKSFILEQTNSSEREFQNLLSLAKEEQEAAASDIAGLEREIRSKMTSISEDRLEFNDNGFIWPVPKNTITSLFHDPDYPFRHIFEHPAVDIRTAQGTPLKAAASGYVARAKDAGKGYSYIMLIHGDGLATVYGHVSKIYVEEDEYVVQGQVIGLSGGLPGTAGAGRLTTGPHLHFEVRQDGLPVNPGKYLP